MTEPTTQDLGTGYRWRPCQRCGATNTRRQSVDGQVVCKNRKACDGRAGATPKPEPTTQAGLDLSTWARSTLALAVAQTIRRGVAKAEAEAAAAARAEVKHEIGEIKTEAGQRIDAALASAKEASAQLAMLAEALETVLTSLEALKQEDEPNQIVVKSWLIAKTIRRTLANLPTTAQEHVYLPAHHWLDLTSPDAERRLAAALYVLFATGNWTTSSLFTPERATVARALLDEMLRPQAASQPTEPTA